MKKAIASDGESKKNKVSLVGARASYFLIFEDDKLVKSIKNPFKSGGGGAGFGVADMLSEEGVNLLISGKIGENMKGALEEKGIDYKEVENSTIEEVI
jgi:predicted Fe-Mo cluster-binding NifX family protein